MNKTPYQKIACAVCMPAILVTVLSLAGCRTADLSPVRPEAGMSAPDTSVVLAPGDELDLRFFYTPELNDLQRIRADGKITLQLVGDVEAAGLTPFQLQQNLQERYAGLIENPSVAVIARNLNHRNIYVTGSVPTPGVQAMPGHLTVLEAIMTAGGFDMNSADLGCVVVVRSENGTRESFSLDLKDVYAGDEPSAPFYLHAQDIVIVPRTGIVKAGQWIDQYITQLIPKTGFSMFYNTGTESSTVGVDTTSRY